MAGHSKWSTIKRKKGALDQKRGKIFSTISKEITVSSRLGGKDIDSNPRLRQAVKKAKSLNMPNSNIDKAIKKGVGELDNVIIEEVSYEGYGPFGVAILIEARQFRTLCFPSIGKVILFHVSAGDSILLDSTTSKLV